jgi:hypothetical protein
VTDGDGDGDGHLFHDRRTEGRRLAPTHKWLMEGSTSREPMWSYSGGKFDVESHRKGEESLYNYTPVAHEAIERLQTGAGHPPEWHPPRYN